MYNINGGFMVHALNKPYCPYKYKYQLVEWCLSYFKGASKSKYQRMSQKQLYAIWYSVMKSKNERRF